MAKKKYYAVKQGKVPGIYGTWDECKIHVDGVSGAKYQSFSSLEEAEKYMLFEEADESSLRESKDENISAQEFNKIVEEKIAALREDESIAFVDGSYNADIEKAGFGVIIISHGGNKDTLYKAFTKNLGENFIALRNVSAELEGVKEAINWAIMYNKKKITVFYDYTGIEQWANGTWKAKNEITKKYVTFIQEKKNYINIEFIKVLAHSGIELNEEADLLARSALLAKGYKTYDDGSVYFVGFGTNDWEKIVEYINKENKALLNETVETINISVKKIDRRNKLTIVQSANRVVINCYPGNKSYVQGKQSVLFQKIIATAVEFLRTGQSVVETLNSFHALTIKKEQVENRFEELLPNFNGKTNDKHYSNLLSSVYNTMLTGYMPDYTCLVTPIFRSYEFCLHRILGDKMGLPTETDRGTNNFAFFSKNSSGCYICNNKNVSILDANQKDYLNKLYTKYNSVRHQYSHWSAEDVDTAVITDIETAREYLIEGLNLIDQYYMLF